MNKRKEYRVFEIRSAEGDTPQISGYAAVFNVSTDIGGMFREKIAPGAFSRALAENQDVRCLFNHEPDHVLGRSTNGTLRMKQDNTGLQFECDLPDTQMGRDVRTLIKRGDVNQCSFAFSVNEEDISYNDDGSIDRTIKDVNLYDVSAVTYPAYESTSCEARSLDEAHKAIMAAKSERADECDCAKCEAGDCENCSNDDCMDENCRCQSRGRKLNQDELETLRLKVALSQR